ncbi:MAG TPA: TIGR00282 family metallophosphoesterase [Syntrophales bacterium]|nr:TIGR00282 family metallophosphoesterase [Syntrophales bacterium]HOX95261.1 TIGR00282 family metallophosphoesterase [Syntrophales bacterium]HPI58264.1 TIGR00282 family metallophosphoesterase [Syntrophales bacterium]HPN25299.1 TIGR00282 family metallophosphoesterase [Syntrophales bacterium]HQM29591.1 TIGR00282 family metallophosphoesterase [Syntrophales bacterium]
MKLLFIGDVVGKPGRRAVRDLLPRIIHRHDIDLAVANVENAAGGFGVTRAVVEEIYESRVDVLTTGNHIWDKKEVMEFIDEYETLLRPANYPVGTPGKGSVLFPVRNGFRAAVLNLSGRVFMKPVDCPFRVAEIEIHALKQKTKVIIVDMHAEATSEKQALGWFLDGEVSAIIGTHTHVQTADETILPKGTAYITDVGMTGPFDSVIGVEKETVIERFLTCRPNKFEVARGDVRLQGVVIDIDPETGRARTVERLSLKWGE